MRYGRAPNIYYLSKEQARLGLDVHIICRGNLPDAEIDGFHVHYVRSPYSINYLQRIVKLSKTWNIDIIHSEGTVGVSYALLRAVLKEKIPIVTQVAHTAIGTLIHSEPIPFWSFPTSALRERYGLFTTLLRERLLWMLTDAIIAPSRSTRTELCKYYHVPARKIHLVPSGVDTELFKPMKTSLLRDSFYLDDRRVVLYVGHFGLRKGIKYLLMAVPRVVNEFPDTLFILVGGTPSWLGTDVYWSILRNTVNQLSIEKHVRLLDAIPHSELPAFYSLAEVFVFPTLYEGLGKALLEAMACQKPVVASATTGVLDVIENGKDGFLVPPRSPTALADAIIELLSNPKKYRDIGRRGRAKILAKFSWQEIAKQTLNAYELVRQSRGG